MSQKQKNKFEVGDLCIHNTFGLGMFLRKGCNLGECYLYFFEKHVGGRRVLLVGITNLKKVS